MPNVQQQLKSPTTCAPRTFLTRSIAPLEMDLGSNKRSRATEPAHPISWAAWSRMARKLLSILIPFNMMIERILGERRERSGVLHRAVQNMEFEDLRQFHEFVAKEVNRRLLPSGRNIEIEEILLSEPESDSFTLLTDQASSTSPSASSSRASRQKKTKAKVNKLVDEVDGMEILFGPRPECHCRLPAALHTSHTEKNPDKMFFRCPKEQGSQCKFFVWTESQPFLELNNWKFRQQPGEDPKTDYDILTEIVQEKCKHQRTNRQGTNHIREKVKCSTCKKLLSDTPVPASSNKQKDKEKEFAQFQEYLKWKETRQGKN